MKASDAFREDAPLPQGALDALAFIDGKDAEIKRLRADLAEGVGHAQAIHRLHMTAEAELSEANAALDAARRWLIEDGSIEMPQWRADQLAEILGIDLGAGDE